MGAHFCYDFSCGALWIPKSGPFSGVYGCCSMACAFVQFQNRSQQNWALQGGPFLISRGSTFWPFFKHVSFARGSKTGPSTDWIRCLLGGPVLSPPKHLLQLRCSNIETHQTNTKLAIRASNSMKLLVRKNVVYACCSSKRQRTHQETCWFFLVNIPQAHHCSRVLTRVQWQLFVRRPHVHARCLDSKGHSPPRGMHVSLQGFTTGEYKWHFSKMSHTSVIKSSFLDQKPKFENQNLKNQNEVSTSTPERKRQLQSFARTQHRGVRILRQDTPTRGQKPQKQNGQRPNANKQGKPNDTQFIMTWWLLRANVWRGNAIPGSKITIFPKRSTEQFHIALITNSARENIIYFQKFPNTLGPHPNVNNQSSLHLRTK